MLAVVGVGCSEPTPVETSDASTGDGSSTGIGSTGNVDSSTSTGVVDGSSDGTTGEPLVVGGDEIIPLFEATDVYFADGDNRRDVDATVAFPEPALAYEGVALYLTLSCPEAGECDWWDRGGYIGVVENVGTEDERVIEVARFITPYRVGGSWALEITHLRPLLAGEQTIRVHIDTWVGPGHANGDGWVVDAEVQFYGGNPTRVPKAVLPLWPHMSFGIGDPANPIETQVAEQTVELPEGTTEVELAATITGHGQGNLDNCAEFCQMTHGFLVGATPVQQVLWRDDCGDNPIDNQQGTWTLPRAGWCPGDMVTPWIEDVTEGIEDGQVTVSYGLTDYDNTCRPDAPTCMGCALGTGCEYDGGNHTAPSYQLSAVLVAY